MSMTDEEHPEPQPSAPERAGGTEQATPGLGESIAAAARRSGLGRPAADEDETSTGAALLGALGGVRGLCETILPGLVFLVLFTFTKNVPVSIVSSVAVALIFTVVRIIGKTPVTQAMAGLIGVGISAILALITGRGEDNFIFGIWINIAFGTAILVSMLVRWPLIGVVAGYLMGGGVEWRHDKRKYRVLQATTLLWLLLFAIRLLVEVPLYLAHTPEATSALAFARLLTGVPPYALLLLVTWFIVKGQFPQKPATSAHPTSSSH